MLHTVSLDHIFNSCKSPQGEGQCSGSQIEVVGERSHVLLQETFNVGAVDGGLIILGGPQEILEAWEGVPHIPIK